MAMPTIIASNQTGGNILLTRLGLTVPASSTLTLTDYATVREIREDESLEANITAGNILLNYGEGNLTKGDSLKFFDIVTLEQRISVRGMSTANIASLSGTTTVDTTVNLVANDRVLLTGQGTASENGVWVVQAGAWVRPQDFETGRSAAAATVYIQEGTAHAGEMWACSSLTGADVIDTDDLTFIGVGGSYGVTNLQTAYEGGNTINATAAEGNIAFTLTSSDFTVDGANGFLIGGTTPLANFTVDTGTMSLDSTDTTNLTMTANAAGNKTLTISSTNSGAGTGLIAMSSDGATDIDAGGILSINSSGGALNLGNDAVAQPINIGTGAAARTITIGNGTGATALNLTSGTGNTLVTSPLVTLTGNLWVQGTTTTVQSEIVNIADSFLYLNDGYTTASALAGGIVVNTLPTATADTVAGSFVPGTTALTPITGTVTGSSGTSTLTGALTAFDTELKVGWTITIDPGGANEETHVIASITDADTLDIVGTLTNNQAGAAVNLEPTNPYVTTTAAATFAVGDFIQVSGANDQTNDGLYEVLLHTGNKLEVAGIGLTAPTFGFTQNQFDPDTVVAGAITKVTIGVMQVDTGGNFQYGYDSDTTIVFNNVINAATLSLQTAYNGGNTITTAGGTDVVIAGTDGLQITGAGGLVVDTTADFNTTSFDVLMSGNSGFSIDGTANSNVSVTNTVAATPVTLTLSGTNTGTGASNTTVDISATSVNGTGTVNVSADDAISAQVLSGGTIGIGTNAVASTTTIGNNTGATAVIINSGTEQVQIDGVTYYGSGAGLPTARAGGFQNGDTYFDTTLGMDMRYDSSRSKWLSVDSMFMPFGRQGINAVNVYYRGTDSQVMSATNGWVMPYAGTVVGLGYTRDDTDAATFDVVEGGTSRAVLASSAVKGKANNLNGDFSADGVLAVMNQVGGNPTTNVLGWVKVKFRST